MLKLWVSYNTDYVNYAREVGVFGVTLWVVLLAEDMTLSSNSKKH